ncbi:MAG: prephenate dehydratase domain-containing protein, partial [Staphylococcus epidermidis]|nr:prephenate dehydratase domain-containing protein [Staphylococcus epidermidis]
MHLYYLGPKGTFSYLAAEQFESHEQYDFIPLSNLHEVIQSVSKDKQAVGIVPIEN